MTRAAIALIGVVTLVLTWYFARWNFANAVAGVFDKSQPVASKIIAEWLVSMAPSDPLTHYAAAVTLEKTFDPTDLERSLREYELSVAASPHNHQTWINLAKARAMTADAAGADAAFRRAAELAPNYAYGKWAYGNFLVQQGETDRGFGLIAEAAVSDPDQYAAPAAATALLIFDADAARVRATLGDNDTINSALAATLAGMERHDAAVEAWERISPAGRREQKHKEAGERLADKLVVDKRYRLAARVTSDLQTDELARPVIGQVLNGGFETPVKLRQAGNLEWRIAEGAKPGIGVSPGQRRTGGFSLALSFNTFDSAEFREVSQVIAVEPGRSYELTCYYRSDLQTKALIKWQVVNAASGIVITTTQPVQMAGDWATLTADFTAPVDADGIMLRLVREGCTGPACPVSGRLFFDDISLRQL